LKAQLLLLLAAALLAGCSKPSPDGDRAVPLRLPLDAASAATPAAVTPIVPSVPMVWTHAQSLRSAWFGPSDAPAQLAIVCEGWERHAGRLAIVRYVPAERGAEAILAIQGSKGILRLPVSAVKVGKDYAWRGELDAADPRAEVLLGNGLKATVPGGGMLTMAPMGPAGELVTACATSAAPAQSLPNLSSNPAVSPAAR